MLVRDVGTEQVLNVLSALEDGGHLWGFSVAVYRNLPGRCLVFFVNLTARLFYEIRFFVKSDGPTPLEANL